MLTLIGSELETPLVKKLDQGKWKPWQIDRFPPYLNLDAGTLSGRAQPNLIMSALEKIYSIYVSTSQPMEAMMIPAPAKDSSGNTQVTHLDPDKGTPFGKAPL